MIPTADPSDGQPTPPDPDFLAGPVEAIAAVGDNPAGRLALGTPAGLLTLSVQHFPAVGIIIVIADGELDTLTAPLLDQRVGQQLAAAPTHLILDLEPVRMLDAGGLSCLLRARTLIHQTPRSQLHLAGLITPRVTHALHLSGLLGLFNTYPTLIHAAVAALTDQPTGARSDPAASAPVLAAVWWPSVATTWPLELHQLHPNMQPGPIVDRISTATPVTQPPPDTLTHDLLATRQLWLFPDPSPALRTNTGHRIGYVCADPELITLAHLVRDQAAKIPVHPVLLASSWIAAGFSTQTAAG